MSDATRLSAAHHRASSSSSGSFLAPLRSCRSLQHYIKRMLTKLTVYDVMYSNASAFLTRNGHGGNCSQTASLLPNNFYWLHLRHPYPRMSQIGSRYKPKMFRWTRRRNFHARHEVTSSTFHAACSSGMLCMLLFGSRFSYRQLKKHRRDAVVSQRMRAVRVHCSDTSIDHIERGKTATRRDPRAIRYTSFRSLLHVQTKSARENMLR